MTSGSEPPFAVLLSAAPPSGRPPPQLTACQTLVAAFVETHRQQGALIRSLREDVDSHRRHTAALRDELGAVCRRQYGEEVSGTEQPPATGRQKEEPGWGNSRVESIREMVMLKIEVDRYRAVYVIKLKIGFTV